MWFLMKDIRLRTKWVDKGDIGNDLTREHHVKLYKKLFHYTILVFIK